MDQRVAYAGTIRNGSSIYAPIFTLAIRLNVANLPEL